MSIGFYGIILTQLITL